MNTKQVVLEGAVDNCDCKVWREEETQVNVQCQIERESWQKKKKKSVACRRRLIAAILFFK